MHGLRMLALSLLLLAFSSGAAMPRKILRADEHARNLLAPDRFSGYVRGFTRDGDSFVCDNGADGSRQSGVHQAIDLNQATPMPVVATAFSRADNVGGSPDADYSLYLDLVYTDGSHLWGQSAPFATGTHDFQQRTVRILPEKPIRRVDVYVLLRRHTGRAIFRDIRLTQITIPEGAGMLDGQPVITPAPSEGWLVRDAAAGGDFIPVEQGAAPGLRVQSTQQPQGSATLHTATFTDESGHDRALTLIYTRPLSKRAWRWLTPDGTSSPAEAPHEYQPGAFHGRLSTFPVAAVADGDAGSAIALDVDHPALFRVGYAAATRELYIAFDIALTRERPRATLSFATFDFDGAWGIRSAIGRYYEVYPEAFRVRIRQQGLWMPFSKISSVQGWEDFGFRIKEGNNEPAWDDAHGILTFRYTEPMTWWMRMPKEMPRTREAALAYARTLAEKGDRSAKALLTSGFHDESGHFAARMLDTPWCDGAVWSMNSAPGIAGDTTDFRNKWNPQLRQKLYESAKDGQVDGEYVDSVEGYVTNEYDYRRDHFASMATPLTFAPDSHKPAIYRGLIAFEYVHALAADLHPRGRFTMANGTPGQLCWLIGQLDVMGTETNWNPDGRWQPMSCAELLHRRLLVGGKPYCFLMNTHFEQFSHELVEKYMKRSIAFGMFPGFFSHNAANDVYFSRPQLYNRDRDLFRKYVPLCQKLAAAGWQPVTLARSGDPAVKVERFGRKYLTAFNESNREKNITIRLAGLQSAGDRELLTARPLSWSDGAVSLTLQPEDVAVLEVK